MNESKEREIETRLERLEKHKEKLDRHDLITDICLVVLTVLIACVLIAEVISIVAGIVSN